MENNYIQQLRFILMTEYEVNLEELEKIIEDYRLTVETIIDETGDEKAVVDQLGAPRVLAKEIAKEFEFIKKVDLNEHWQSNQTESDTKWNIKKGIKTLPIWAKVVLTILLILILFPTAASIVGIAVGGIVLGLGLVVTGIILIPQFLSSSPWLIIMLFVAGILTLIFMVLTIAFSIRGVTYLVNLVAGKKNENKKPRKKWRMLSWSLVLVTMLIAHASLFVTIETNKEIREKLPYQMYRFQIRHSDKTEVAKKSFEKNEIQKLILKGSGTSINVAESPDDKYHVTVYGNNTTIKNAIALNNGELKVNVGGLNNVCFMCVNLGGDTKVVVETPKSVNLQSVFLEIMGGEANLKDVTANQVEMRLTGGSIYADTIEATDINVRVTGGESRFEKINTKTSEFYVSGGSIDIKTLKADDGLFNVTGGSINVRKGDIGKIERNIKGGSVDIG